MRAEPISLNPQIEAFLNEAGLPTSDLASASSLDLLAVRDGGRLAGIVGIEAYGAVGLLRSLAVMPARRQSGLGLSLVSDAEAWAAQHGIGTLYLLTTTAAGYFARLGYEVIPRSEAPAAVAASAQFKDLCPASSVFMRKVLTAHESLQDRRT